jgi:hypothetical protein
MLLNLIVYSILAFGIFSIERQFDIFDKLPFPDLCFVSVIIGPYLFFLFIVVKNNMNLKHNYWSINKEGFKFSFWVGVIWGLMISFHRGLPSFNSVNLILGKLAAFIVMGLIVGLIGMVISIKFYNQITKSRKTSP